VIELHPATSLVLLLTDPESRVGGIVERSRETGLLVGKSRSQCEFIYLDVQADIQAGDRILTAGLGGPFPKGLLLGVVAEVIRDEVTGSARAIVNPSARLGKLEEVLCLSPHHWQKVS
jgi:rod shape-determining protein MreC